MEGKTIFIPVKTYKSNIKEKNVSTNRAAFSLEGFVQIEYKYLVHLHNSWIKYKCNGISIAEDLFLNVIFQVVLKVLN